MSGPALRIDWEGGETAFCSWGAFAEANSGEGADWLATVRALVSCGATVMWGGGAAPLAKIRRDGPAEPARLDGAT